MGSVIWKYQLTTGLPSELTVPTRFEPLAVRWHGKEGPTLWARVDPHSATKTVRIRIYGTGEPLEDPPGSYLGTVFTPYGALVFHIYMKGPA